MVVRSQLFGSLLLLLLLLFELISRACVCIYCRSATFQNNYVFSLSLSLAVRACESRVWSFALRKKKNCLGFQYEYTNPKLDFFQDFLFPFFSTTHLSSIKTPSLSLSRARSLKVARKLSLSLLVRRVAGTIDADGAQKRPHFLPVFLSISLLLRFVALRTSSFVLV